MTRYYGRELVLELLPNGLVRADHLPTSLVSLWNADGTHRSGPHLRGVDVDGAVARFLEVIGR